MSDGVKCESSLPPATVCGDRVDAQTCGGKQFFLGTGNPLQRSRRSGIQTCGKRQIKFVEAPRRPFARNEGQTSKAGVKFAIL